MTKTKLTPMLWLATDGEIVIAETVAFAGEGKDAWALVPGSLKGEARMTQEECVLVRSTLARISADPNKPQKWFYTPLVAETNRQVQTNALARTSPEGMMYARFCVDVRETLLRIRLEDEARSKAWREWAQADGPLPDEVSRRVVKECIAVMRASAATRGDQETIDKLEADLETLVSNVTRAKRSDR